MDDEGDLKQNPRLAKMWKRNPMRTIAATINQLIDWLSAVKLISNYFDNQWI